MQAALSKAAAENTVCPLAAWGAAHSYQADYNGIFMEPDNVDAKLQLAGEQLAALENPTEMEKLVIAAEQARGADPDAKAYVTAMKAAFDALPNDPDVAALFAHAVMLQRPWSLFELKAGVDGKPPLPPSEDFLFGTQAALDAIAQGLVVSPDHPGLLHLWIHAAEMGSYGMIEACRPGSDRLLNVSRGTACGHLLHMPAHIYCLQGDWQAAIEANVLAVEADKQVVALDPEYSRQQWYTVYRCHNSHMLIYGAMFAGQLATAMRYATEMESAMMSLAQEDRVAWDKMSEMCDAFIPMPVHVMVRFGQWDELLNPALLDKYSAFKNDAAAPEHIVAVTTLHYGRGIALAVQGDVQSARAEQEVFKNALKDLKARKPVRKLMNNVVSMILDVAAEMLEGEILYREGKIKEAFEHLEAAVLMNDGSREVYDLEACDRTLVYDEPWAWMQPARHALGALRLEQHHLDEAEGTRMHTTHLDEAEAAYRQDLGMTTPAITLAHPNNIWSLTGLEECLRIRIATTIDCAESVAKDHAEILPRLEAARKLAEVAVKASCACKTK